MKKYLDDIKNIDDLKKLNIKEKEILANEIREEIIEVVSQNGGHLASNLGVVELTIALHSVFNVPEDSIVWDVGHQTYTHKILTGRREEFKTLRKKNGIAGFPKIEESDVDCFNTGHSSTSISASLGLAKARDLKKDGNVIAVIGDGALTGGMALEAVNDAGSSNTRLIVILNDNQMSISKNVGGISLFLGRLRTRKVYTSSNNIVKVIVRKIPYFGEKIIRSVRKIKYSIKNLMIPNIVFEDMGFKYFGPVDGHSIEKLESILEISKKVNGPVLVHIVTKKGKGYKPAEENPDRFHGVGAFNIDDGKSKKEKQDDYSKIFGEKLVSLAKNDERIVAITASMRDGTGLTKFAKEYPDRFFDVGIAEQHAVCFAAGLARAGLKPVIPIYSSFYQRAYDQMIHDVCIQNLPVLMCADRAGIVGKDGETHQGIFDLSFTSIVPNLTVMAPKDFMELEQMLEFGIKMNSPVFIRYPRGGQGRIMFSKHETIELGKQETLQVGNDILLLAIGNMVERAMDVANNLAQENISCEVINMRFLKPINEEKILRAIEKTKNVITIEDNLLAGGLGAKIKELIAGSGIENVKIKCFGYPDEFIKQAEVNEIEKEYGLDVSSITKYCKESYEQARDFEEV